MKCLQCDSEFEGVRSTAKYCSDKCRKLAFQKVSVPDVLGVSVLPDKYLDLAKDLKLDAGKDLGITGWTKDGIFIRPDITVEQVQNIARMIHAKHGRVCPPFFNATL